MRMSTALCNGADKGKKDEPKAAGGGFLVNMVPTQFEGIVKLDPKMKGPDSDLEPKDGELEENSNEEMTNMKELLLIHLDFIQLQSEQLQKRDKLIDDLKNDNEMVMSRVVSLIVFLILYHFTRLIRFDTAWIVFKMDASLIRFYNISFYLTAKC